MTLPGQRGVLLGYLEGRDAAAWMQEQRRAAGLSREQLAERLGFTPAWVAERERGAIRISVAEQELITEALSTGLAELTEEEP